MFSYFENGIRDTSKSEFLGLPELVKVIRNHPNSDKIHKIRVLRSNDDDNYKKLKKQLPNITPNCLVSIRSLEGDNFKANFIQPSGYIYIDLDVGHEASRDYKRYFIEKYGDRATLICLSSSAGGISVLFRVKTTVVTNENFDDIWNYIKDNILAGEPVDPNSKGIGRAMFISHDPDVYINYENEIDIQLTETAIIPVEKRVKQSITGRVYNYTLNSPFSTLSIKEVLPKLITSTKVEVLNPIVDFKPIEYVEVYFPRFIKDGTKHKIYRAIIHNLMYLNPDIEKIYIYSYLKYINYWYARPQMERKELFRLVDSLYDKIKKTGKTYHQKEIKNVHFNPNIENQLSKDEKIKIANTLNGYQRRNLSIKKIQEAINELEQSGQKITQKRIAEISRLSVKTVRAHLNSSIIDMDEMVRMINDSVSFNDCGEVPQNPTSTPGNDFKQAFPSRKDKDPINDVANPEWNKFIKTINRDHLKLGHSTLTLETNGEFF